jgi:hypothetical protein
VVYELACDLILRGAGPRGEGRLVFRNMLVPYDCIKYKDRPGRGPLTPAAAAARAAPPAAAAADDGHRHAGWRIDGLDIRQKPARGTVLGRLRARSASPGMEVPYPVMSEREMFLLDTQGYLRSVH